MIITQNYAKKLEKINIKLNAESLAKTLFENVENIGGTDWDIYIDLDGNIDTRHNTFDNSGWYEIFDLYSIYDDNDTFSEFNDLFVQWVKEMVDLNDLEREIEESINGYDEDDKTIVNINWE